MKILITGGHLSPALAVIEELGSRASVVFVGRKYALDQEKNFSLEYLEIKKRQIPFYHLQSGRLTRLLNLKSLLNLIKIPFGLYRAFKIFLKVKPDLVLSFGGYLGFPVCFAAFILKKPIFIHEQTIKPGLSNRLVGLMAKKIFLAFPEAKKYFTPAKVVLSGNPVRKNIFQVNKKPFDLKKNRPVIYITGGSLGSHSINLLVAKILPKLLEKYIVIHQTGNVSKYNDFKTLSQIRDKLTNELKKNYFLKTHFFTDELGYIYSICDLLVGRSGANTAFELLAAKIPAIFIPLPWSAGKEQLMHAQLFQKKGTAEILEQSQAAEKLLEIIAKVLSNLKYYKNNFKNLELLDRKNAAEIILQTILSQHSS